MRLKTPIIATTAGNIPELIDDGKEGRLVRFNDEKALVAALRELLEDGPDAEALRARYADNAYEKSQRFSIEATLDELVKLF